MGEMKATVEAILAAHVPADGMKAIRLYGDLFHGMVDAMPKVIGQAMRAAREAGKARPCPNNGGHEAPRLEPWDDFLEKGLDALEVYEATCLIRMVDRHLAQVFLEWMRDPDGAARAAHPGMGAAAAGIIAGVKGIEVVTPAHLPRLAALLAAELEDPRTPPVMTLDMQFRSAVDDRPLELRLEGWMPVLYEMVPDGSGVQPTTLPVMAPPVRHFEMVTGGRLLVIGRKDFGGIFMEAMEKAEEQAALPWISIASNEGANEHARDIYGATGFLAIHMGDHFPQLVADRVAGVIRGCWTGEEDLPESCEMLHDSGLHMPVLACLDRARALVERLGLDVEAAMAELDDGAAFVLDVPPGILHVYAPDGWRVEDFDAQFAPEGLSRIEGAEDCFCISPRPLDPGCAVTHVDLPAPPSLEDGPEPS